MGDSLRGEGLSLPACGTNPAEVERRFGRFRNETGSLLGGIGRLAGGIGRGTWGIGGIAAGIGGLLSGASGWAMPNSCCCFLKHSGRISKCCVYPLGDLKKKLQ